MNSALSPRPESSVALRVAERNRQTRDLQSYASHRDQTMRILTTAAAGLSQAETASLSVLGAGNCLDLDLKQLTTLFRRINLLDLDRAALEHGLHTQLPDHDDRSAMLRNWFQLIAPYDLATPLASLSEEDFAPGADINPICCGLTAALEIPPAAPADVVISTCVLSQMIDGLMMLSSQQHPGMVALLQALRRGHFRRMLQLLKPGGQGIFLTDLVSSESTPALHNVNDGDLPQLLATCLSTGNFFSGLNPGVVLQELSASGELKAECCDAQVLAPWKWQMGPRVYAVYAIVFRRRGGGSCAGTGPPTG